MANSASASSKTDTASVSGESSNSRNSTSNFPSQQLRIYIIKLDIYKLLVTTDSQTSEEDSVPPPLPVKHRDSENGNLNDNYPQHLTNKTVGDLDECYQTVSRPFPISSRSDFVSNAHYELFEMKSREIEMKAGKKNPPTPPPKPLRGSKGSLSP